ncbi:hypothetical protein K432DRAFT_386288 [Lepidopterella palustris CBS 459.81]|uniref:Heterokaryon incompatibility domain-containing protein n=1 Tax=Lepidopterella palustris CBS 459.81 TaxID=1314670 RepID=A0A8E2E1A1_9PEZI|nr:hypothetical protein K432DRAFT_386288 [Lepidopterella palustris CBS 459.81]
MASELEIFSLLEDFSYEPIPKGEYIRVLKLDPGHLNDPIRCQLRVVSLQDVWRTYEAISYVWGEPNSTRWIIIDGKRWSITTSLFEALQCFRDDTVAKTIWADAICIKQTDPPEKGYQVQLMGKIYSGASRVRVWLGPDHLGIAKEATEFIKETVKVARGLCDSYGSIANVPTLSNENNPVSQDPQKWKLYETFINLPWFSRVWVIQEVGLAADAVMYWGNAKVRFSELINLNEFLYHAQHLFSIFPMSWLLHDAFYGIFNLYGNPDSWRGQLIPEFPMDGKRLTPSPNFVDVLLQGSRRGVTDIRDYIFGFLGHPLAKEGDEFIVKADYQRHVDDVYFEVAAKLVKWLGPALPLAVAGGMGRRSPRDLESNQPSWVIRWDLGQQVSTLGRPGHWFTAGGTGMRTKVDIDPTSKTLTMTGVISDCVTWVSELILTEDIVFDSLIPSQTRTPALDWIWNDLKDRPCRYSGDARRDAMTLTLVAGRYQAEEKAEDYIPHHRRTVSAYSQYIELMRKAAAGRTSSKKEDIAEELRDEAQLRSDAREYEDTYTWTAHDRRVFLTKNGFYGLGPPLLKEGDRVAVFQGVVVPYCLRPVEGEVYKLVGVCYVHGIMRGEVFDPTDPLGLHCELPKDIIIA